MSTAIIFIQDSYYLKNTNLVLDELNIKSKIFVSRKDFATGNASNLFTIANFIQLLCFIIKNRNNNYKFLVASNLDDPIFKCMFHFLSYESFISFDEGQRSIVADDFYFHEDFNRPGQRRNKLLNKIFGIPMPTGKYFDYSDKHFTFYHPDYIYHNLSAHKNLVFLDKEKIVKPVSKIFVGISTDWRYLGTKTLSLESQEYIDKIIAAANVINFINPDIYLMHPRENNDLVDYLNSSINILRDISGQSHNLINKIASTNELVVFSDKSGVLFDLNNDIEIAFIDLFQRFDIVFYSEFVDSFNKYRKGIDPSSKECFIKKLEDFK